MNTVAIRGAITVKRNTREDILHSTMELLSNIEKRNNIDKQNVIGIIFSTTNDLNKEYPAIAARNMGYSNTSLMCFNEMYVEGSLNKCIRLMMLYNCNMKQNQINHVYLREAKTLRPDLDSDS